MTIREPIDGIEKFDLVPPEFQREYVRSRNRLWAWRKLRSASEVAKDIPVL